mmetsp:Transcript_107025/g.282229  ORF Transcript_107025/g.282229 Transcript_107025/m.282229 type:complete len:241 (+) Transcript_107025:132-854(+)
MIFDTVCFSMNSLMSRRIMESVEPKNVDAKVLHTWVLPTPVGPQKMKLAIGLSGFRSPARARRSALATASTASSWPMMVLWSAFSRPISFLDSLAPTCSTAMPVQLATTSAMSFSVTGRSTRAMALSTPSILEMRSEMSRSRAFSSCASPKRSASTSSCTCAFRPLNSSSRTRASGALPTPRVFCSSLMRSLSSTSRTFSCCASSYRSEATAAFFCAATALSSWQTAQISAAALPSSASW